MEQRVISVRCQDHAGVINRITALFFSRDISVHNLTSCETEDPNVREIFIELFYDQEKVAYVVKLLKKLIDIIEVADVTEDIQLGRQHTLVRIQAKMDSFKLEFNDINATFLGVRSDWIYLEISDSIENTKKTIEKLHSLGKVILVKSGSLFLK